MVAGCVRGSRAERGDARWGRRPAAGRFGPVTGRLCGSGAEHRGAGGGLVAERLAGAVAGRTHGLPTGRRSYGRGRELAAGRFVVVAAGEQSGSRGGVVTERRGSGSGSRLAVGRFVVVVARGQAGGRGGMSAEGGAGRGCRVTVRWFGVVAGRVRGMPAEAREAGCWPAAWGFVGGDAAWGRRPSVGVRGVTAEGVALLAGLRGAGGAGRGRREAGWWLVAVVAAGVLVGGTAAVVRRRWLLGAELVAGRWGRFAGWPGPFRRGEAARRAERCRLSLRDTEGRGARPALPESGRWCAWRLPSRFLSLLVRARVSGPAARSCLTTVSAVVPGRGLPVLTGGAAVLCRATLPCRVVLPCRTALPGLTARCWCTALTGGVALSGLPALPALPGLTARLR